MPRLEIRGHKPNSAAELGIVSPNLGRTITAEETFRNAINKDLSIKYVTVQREEAGG